MRRVCFNFLVFMGEYSKVHLGGSFFVLLKPFVRRFCFNFLRVSIFGGFQRTGFLSLSGSRCTRKDLPGLFR